MKLPYPIHQTRRRTRPVLARHVALAIAIPLGCAAAAWVFTTVILNLRAL